MKKSRTLAQIKRRLLDTITYHHNEGETLKNEHKSIDTGETQSIQRAERASPASTDDSLLPALSIIDLTGESSGSSDSDENADDSRSEKEASPNREAIEAKRNIFNLITYHAAAEKMLNEYLSWLEEGEKVRAPPHFADIARYIPEHALEAAWKRAVPRPLPSIEMESFPLPTSPPPPDTTPPQTPFHIAVDNILKIKDHSRRRRKRTIIKSPVEDVDFRDARTLLSLVDKHLKDIERLAHDWCTEVSRVSALDNKLWELVSVLRVRRALPPVRKSCANKCKPITIYIPEQEWCISVDAERGIKENRHSARATLRRLARARPHAAKTAAALHTIARRTCNSEAGVRVVERAWRCAGAPTTGACAPAATLLTALTTDLAERWICHDGRLCADLLSAWGKRASSVLQQTLCGALLAPRRLAPGDWHKVYTALLASSLPSHAVFSYLSKFEMSRWSETADATQRRDMLEALIHAVQRWGPTPAPEHTMLVELLGVHSAVLVDSRELCAHIVRCMTAAINNTLPPAHWTHVVRAVETKASGVPFDQLGHAIRSLGVSWWEARTGMSGARGTSHAAHAPHVARLLHALQRAAVAAARALSYEPERAMSRRELGHVTRSLGVSWWEARTGMSGARGTSHAAHAPHVARLLHALQRAAVAAARALSYEPERVAWYAWAALQESWGPWVSPHPAAAPLLPSTGDHEQYTPMLRHFVDNVHQVMLDCPGTEVPLLQQIFEWSVQTYLSVQGSVTAPSMPGTAAQESRVQASAMLAELAKLPWSEHQWFFGKCLQQALQMSNSSDRELTTWCCNAWRGTLADTLLRGCDSTQIAPRLAELLYLFTGTLLPHSQQILDEACKLPWSRLPEPALDEALDRFYMLHHNPAVPYHDLPQFRLILVACSLCVCDTSAVRSVGTCRAARARGVSQWVRGACAPTLATHVPAHTVHVLGTVTELGMLCVCDTSAVRSVGTCRAARARGVSQWVRGACAPTLATHVPAHTVHVLGTVTELGMLCVCDTSAVRSVGTCRAARARGVSQWVRGACAPTLATHVPAHTVHVLGTVTELGMLCVCDTSAVRSVGTCRAARARGVSQWVRGACAPTLATHVPAHTVHVLGTVTELGMLCVCDTSAVRSVGTCRAARARGVSQWVRGACAPTLATHVPAHTVHVLGTVTELGMLCVCDTSAVRSVGTCRAARARGVSQWVRGACAPTLATHVPAHTVHVLGTVTELGMLCVCDTSAVRSVGTCRAARARGVSQWVRGACAPTLATHVPAHTVHVLGTVTELGMLCVCDTSAVRSVGTCRAARARGVSQWVRGACAPTLATHVPAHTVHVLGTVTELGMLCVCDTSAVRSVGTCRAARARGVSQWVRGACAPTLATHVPAHTVHVLGTVTELGMLCVCDTSAVRSVGTCRAARARGVSQWVRGACAPTLATHVPAHTVHVLGTVTELGMLCVCDTSAVRSVGTCRAARARGVSQWVRGACAPTLATHVPAHTVHVLGTVTELGMLCVCDTSAVRSVGTCRAARARGVSQWVRGACAPTLATHVPAHTVHVLGTVTELGMLCVCDTSAVRSVGTCRAARARGVSQWVRGACAPTLATHVPAHTVHVLGTVTELGMLCVCDTSAVRSVGTCRAARARGVSQWVRGACAPTLATHVPAHTVHVLGTVTELGMLCVCDTSAVRSVGTCRAARARGVSQWVRGACAPTLATHVPAHTVHVLGTVTELAVYLDETQGEIEELLSRAVVIMCIEPAAAAALPVWVTWVTDGPIRLVRACVSAVAALTVFEYFATLAEAAVRALLLCNEPYGWREVSHRWSSCPWREAHTLAQRGRVHAAYACALTHPHDAAAVRATLAALLTADIHFPDNEPIIAVWICYACRMAVTHSAQSGQSDASRECGAAARALLARWAEQPRRSILRVVTMHADTDKPTALHRVLCRYALCILTPDESTRRAYESACAATLGANNDVTSWAGSPQLNKLVRLACRLWPKHEKYFQCEMEMAPDVVSV
uniref:Epg5-like central TPR repeats domain-containing protein n=1 Tax=Heliothis virescens TaxID=7102 RepID=A0A2A4JJK7_HELVI